MTGTSHLWNSSTTPPRRTGYPNWGERGERFCKGPAYKPIGTRCHRLLGEKTRQLAQGHPSVGVCVRRTTFSGGGGVPGDDVPLLRCDGPKHAACASAPLRSSTSTSPRSTRSPSPLSRLPIRHQVESGASFNVDSGLRMDIVIDREASEIIRQRSIATKSDTAARRHVCRITNGGPQSCRQR